MTVYLVQINVCNLIVLIKCCHEHAFKKVYVFFSDKNVFSLPPNNVLPNRQQRQRQQYTFKMAYLFYLLSFIRLDLTVFLMFCKPLFFKPAH